MERSVWAVQYRCRVSYRYRDCVRGNDEAHEVKLWLVEPVVPAHELQRRRSCVHIGGGSIDGAGACGRPRRRGVRSRALNLRLLICVGEQRRTLLPLAHRRHRTAASIVSYKYEVEVQVEVNKHSILPQYSHQHMNMVHVLVRVLNVLIVSGTERTRRSRRQAQASGHVSGFLHRKWKRKEGTHSICWRRCSREGEGTCSDTPMWKSAEKSKPIATTIRMSVCMMRDHMHIWLNVSKLSNSVIRPTFHSTFLSFKWY